jgi:Asp-tRNA(Asn)/Glu-tRNA(Gln) amidotransferase A subunit family amidase
MSLIELDASAAAARLRTGEIRSEELVKACLDRIAAVDEQVQAWAFLDPELALRQARRADEAHRAGISLGTLHGLPVGIKDIIDTRDMPTENGTVLLAGRRPTSDATLVALLRQAGAVIMGKTVTTELAVYAPGKSRNPHDHERTPGGSSSGSAAAVAAGMVPLALGTQTNGSVIRPAAFCGVYGYKPTHGSISRHGVLTQSPPFDTVGVFGRGVSDLALLADPLTVYDDRDSDMRPVGRPTLAGIAAEEPPLEPNFAFVKTPVWDKAESDTVAAFEELVGFLGERCDTVELPAPFENAWRWHNSLMCADLAKNFHGLYERGKEQLSPILRSMLEEGQRCLAVDYNRALEWRGVLNSGLEEIFSRFDAILTPAAPGEAPLGLDSTGSPAFCTLWSYCGTPAVSLPLLRGGNGMPLGVQLVGRRGNDGRLLRTARWLARRINADLEET